MSGSQNTDMVYKKSQQKVLFMRVLGKMQIDKIRNLVYKYIIESVVIFSIVIWYGMLKVKDKEKLNKNTVDAEVIVALNKSRII